ncbi:MAG: single-stranded-DNA-specific exonuclease RecJ, partial [Acidaminococcaceae bacterium]
MLNRKIILQEKEDKQQAVQLAKAVGISPLLAEILISRGYTDVATVKTFLYGALQPFHDPFLLKDMEPAVERIILALNRDEKITIYGDYDVDGIT